MIRPAALALALALALLALAASPAAAATVTLEPSSGPAGSEAAVTSVGLSPHAVVELRVAGGARETLVADENGRAAAPVRIPAGATGAVPVEVVTGAGERARLGFRVASPYAERRSAAVTDWRGRLLLLTTRLDHGRLATRAALSGLPRGASVRARWAGQASRARAGRRGRATIRMRLPATAAGTLLRVRGRGVRLGAPLQNPPAVLAAAGDIACQPGWRRTATTCRHADTARLTARFRPDAAALLGDLQYQSGRLSHFRRAFGRTWGRLRMPLRPVPGNHEYRTEGAAGYFRYFAQRTGWRPPHWYAFDVGAWHLIALDSNCEFVDCGPGSEQERWLRANLAAHPGRCTIAYWHHPRYSSGFHGSDPRTSGWWRILQEAGAELVLAGHDHIYERFAPQNAGGAADPDGIRSFVIGTGGKNTTPLRSLLAPHSDYARDDIHGVLILDLYETSYRWRYVRLGGRVLDSGRGACR